MGGSTHRPAVGGVPGVVAGGPGQHARERGEEEPQGPSYDHVVVEVDVEGDQDDGVSDSCVYEKGCVKWGL